MIPGVLKIELNLNKCYFPSSVKEVPKCGMVVQDRDSFLRPRSLKEGLPK